MTTPFIGGRRLKPSPILSDGYVTATATVETFEVLKYDPSGGTFTISLPDSGAISLERGDLAGTKNITTSTTSVTVDAPNSTLEDPGTPGSLSASVSVGVAGAANVWQFDGYNWWLM